MMGIIHIANKKLRTMNGKRYCKLAVSSSLMAFPNTANNPPIIGPITTPNPVKLYKIPMCRCTAPGHRIGT